MTHSHRILSTLLFLSLWSVPCLSEWRGGDISLLPDVERHGGVYYNENGQEQDLPTLLADNGFNTIRIHIFHSPVGKCCGTDEAIELAHRVKAVGMNIILDFHLSDDWANGGNQKIPKAWEGKDIAGLSWEVKQYTKRTLQAFYDESIDPIGVQIGNEVRYMQSADHDSWYTVRHSCRLYCA